MWDHTVQCSFAQARFSFLCSQPWLKVTPFTLALPEFLQHQSLLPAPFPRKDQVKNRETVASFIQGRVLPAASVSITPLAPGSGPERDT